MQLTIRILGVEMLHVELCESSDEDTTPDRGVLTATAVGFTPQPGDQRWEQGVET